MTFASRLDGAAPAARARPRPRGLPERAVAGLLLALLCAVALVLIGMPLYAVLSKSLQDAAGRFAGLANFAAYVSNPGLVASLGNTLIVCALTTAITLPLAFLYALALVRSRLPCKALFKGISLLPLLAPSLLPAIALTYMFGNQGYLKSWLGGHPVYGLIGIVAAQVFYCFPHAVLILATALGLSDARMYEVARSLNTRPLRAFLTITLPSARYGLISAAFVIVTLSVTDFGIAKVIGGQFNVLAIDIYKQIIGQQNFQMGAVVGVVLLVPAVLSFVIDAVVRRRQRALLNARSVLYRPEARPLFDGVMGAFAVVVALAILSIVGTAVFASLVKLWPYDLSLALGSYDFAAYDSLGWGAYYNSLAVAAWTAVAGTVLAFGGAYLVGKIKAFRALRQLLHFLAMLPLAVPGLVLGLGFVFFFNDPANPLSAIKSSLWLMTMCCVAHYYTVPHLTALTALQQIDGEFEAASASLGVPFWTTFRRVTVPICLPAILDIATYFFVNAMTTVAAVIFLYEPLSMVASVAAVAMDDTGDTAAACAMAVMVLLTSALVKFAQSMLAMLLGRRAQAWRHAGRD
ncbi:MULTISPECIES: putative 2-aminoethylphosphonate ABC transporter permease subunit [Cupriavidus]